MSWKASGVEHLRAEFVLVASEPDVSKSAACRDFGISRKTGYKWLRRYADLGLAGLADRSRRPRTNPLQVSGAMVVELVRLRQAHPHWGPKKLRALLVRSGYRLEELPSLTTLGRILQRARLEDSEGLLNEPRNPVMGGIGNQPAHRPVDLPQGFLPDHGEAWNVHGVKKKEHFPAVPPSQGLTRLEQRPGNGPVALHKDAVPRKVHH